MSFVTAYVGLGSEVLAVLPPELFAVLSPTVEIVFAVVVVVLETKIISDIGRLPQMGP